MAFNLKQIPGNRYIFLWIFSQRSRLIWWDRGGGDWVYGGRFPLRACLSRRRYMYCVLLEKINTNYSFSFHVFVHYFIILAMISVSPIYMISKKCLKLHAGDFEQASKLYPHYKNSMNSLGDFIYNISLCNCWCCIKMWDNLCHIAK